MSSTRLPSRNAGTSSSCYGRASARSPSQPGTSKHLRVLREVGLVRGRRAGKQRLYALDAGGLRPVHEWTGGFEQFWHASFDRLDAYLSELQQTKREDEK